MTDILAATDRFESWLSTQVTIWQDELDHKHAQMACKSTSFPFFRGTYYRWAEIWPEICPESQEAPAVLAVGDLHIENFGTWRDREGRLVWGVNDFDEADDLPFTNDLIRLAASGAIGAGEARFQISFKRICQSILSGYVTYLQKGGLPFVLEEDHLQMRLLATQADRDPAIFWKKLTQLLKHPPAEVSTEIETVLKADLQGAAHSSEIRRRSRVGMGSLGKPRYVALAGLMGGWVAREAKANTPPATSVNKPDDLQRSRVSELLCRAVRCADPFLRVDGGWIVRRLAPRCSRIEVQMLDSMENEILLFESMGAETANIHSGTPDAIEQIVQWLDKQEPDWLVRAARKMIRATTDDWKAWRKSDRNTQKL